LKIGDCVLAVRSETNPCVRMDEQHPSLMAALMPNLRGGGGLVNGGVVQVGQEVLMVAV